MGHFDILPFPPERGVVVDAGYLGTGRHIAYGLVEVDVTRARELRRQLSERDKAKISFTAFIAASLARAIASNPKVQAYRDWRGRLVVFHDVDVVTMIEAEQGAVAIPHIIRNANRRTVRDISDEIRSIQASPGKSEQQEGSCRSGATNSPFRPAPLLPGSEKEPALVQTASRNGGGHVGRHVRKGRGLGHRLSPHSHFGPYRGGNRPETRRAR